MLNLYKDCRLCPRECGVNRERGEAGFCGETSDMRLAAAVLHFGEEPPLTGVGGSGAVFFSGCTLKCPFCQNRQISSKNMGGRVSIKKFVEICLLLQTEGAENINLITGTHFIPSILSGLCIARSAGLNIPVLWNSSGFESVNSLTLLNPSVDVYLPDVKTLNPGLASSLFGQGKYPESVKTTIETMVLNKPLIIRDDKILQGVVVRHLVLPGHLESTRQVLAWFKEFYYGKALISVMAQYTPVGAAGPPPSRKLSQDEYDEVLDILTDLGIEDGFIQELEDDGSWLPDFSKIKSFPAGPSRTLWHWSEKNGT